MGKQRGLLGLLALASGRLHCRRQCRVPLDDRNSKRSYLDLTGEYSITRRLALFANLRNINKPVDDVEITGPTTPAHAQLRQRQDFGSLWTFGVKGSF